MTHWTFQPILDSYLSVALLTLCMVFALLVPPAFGRLNRARRRTLLALRAGVILLVLLAMLRPTRIGTTAQPQSATVLLLFDQSRSMLLPHASGNKSRWQAQREAIAQAEKELRALASEMNLKAFGYDRQLHPAECSQGRIALPGQPTGDETDIGSALDDAVQQQLGQRLAAAILLGDGAQTAFAPRIEVQEAGRTLARLDCPLYTVCFGPPGDTTQARDVWIENLPEQYTVFVKNELIVKGILRARGFVNQPILVELIVEDPAGGQATAGTQRLQPQEDGQPLGVQIRYTPSQPGQYKLTLRAQQQPGELVTSNNQLSAFLTVLEGGLRVFYVYGDRLGEQRILRRSLDASPDMQLDDLFVDPKNRDRWPVDLGNALTQPGFDVLILESVDAAALGEASLRLMAQAVDRGKGLLMIGGFHSFGAGGYYGTPLADVLPVVMGRLERQDFELDKPISSDLHLRGPLPMLPTSAHPITSLGRDEENLAVWRSLPPLLGANRLKEKPRSQVLAATPAGDPLLIAGDYGPGRVLAFAGDSTHRWWQYGRQAEHRRFWRQVILWLAHRDDVPQDNVWIKLAQRRFNPGSRVTFTAGATSAAGDAIPGASISARCTAPGGPQQPLRLAADKDQVTATLDRVDQPGDYLIEVEATQAGRPLGKARANFQVLDRDAELSNPAANYDLMARLAGATKEAGGSPVAPEQLPELLREIRARRPQLQVEVQSRWQLADTALDAWLFLLLFLSVLTAEWAARKHWGLV
mgnify:CR=1 FL=1